MFVCFSDLNDFNFMELILLLRRVCSTNTDTGQILFLFFSFFYFDGVAVAVAVVVVAVTADGSAAGSLPLSRRLHTTHSPSSL